MSLQRSFKFYAIAVLRGQKFRADEQQDQVSGSQIVVNLILPIIACSNFSIVPRTDQPLSLQDGHVSPKPFERPTILTRVRNKNRAGVTRASVRHKYRSIIVNLKIWLKGIYMLHRKPSYF